MNNSPDYHPSPWFVHFIAPAITGVIIGLFLLVAGIWAQPLIAARTERWNAKRDAYLRVLTVVNQKYDSMKWTGPDALQEEVPLQKPPTAQEINRSYTELMLFSGKAAIISTYLDCFGIRNTNEPIRMVTRNELINDMREDLGFEQIEITPDMVKYIKIP